MPLRNFQRALLPLALVGLARVGRAQAPSAFDRERGRVMLESIRKDLEREYFDSTFHGTPLGARFAGAVERIDQAASLDGLLVAIAEPTLALGDSHTLFLPPQRTISVDYGWEMAAIGDSCYVTAVVKGSDAEARGLRPGDAVLAVNGHAPSRALLPQMEYVYHAIRPQPGLRLVVRSPDGAPRQLDVAAGVRQRYRLLDLTRPDLGSDFWRLVREEERAEERDRARYTELGDVLYWKQPTFDVDDEVVRDLAKRARGKRAVVLDLRGNGGGRTATLAAMLGAFFGADRPVATFRARRESTTLVAHGAGRDSIGGALVVLVDSRSASASELFARAAQLANRGRVIGDRTAGAVMVSRVYPHQTGGQTVAFYAVSVAVAAVEMPDGGRLEGTGVAPDELSVPTPRDLAEQRDPVLTRALATLGVDLAPEKAYRLSAAR